MREVASGKGFRIYQVRKPQNRHLVDVRPVTSLPTTQLIDKLLVVTPAELLANKVIALSRRKNKPKGGTDWRDIAVLLLKFPELKMISGTVADRMAAADADDDAIRTWRDVVNQQISQEADADEFQD